MNKICLRTCFPYNSQAFIVFAATLEIPLRLLPLIVEARVQVNMRLSLITTLGHGFVSTRVWSQEIFEPSDFDITKALLKKGVNISHTSGLAGLTESSALNGCSIAVSLLFNPFVFIKHPEIDCVTVQLTTANLWRIQSGASRRSSL